MEEEDRANLARWLREEHVPEVATHEAGHTVVSVLTGAGVEVVFLRSADEDDAYDRGLVVGQHTPADIFATTEHQDAMISAGGLVAESIRRGDSLEDFLVYFHERLDPCESEPLERHCDESTLLKIAEKGVNLDATAREAWELLSDRWAAVEAISAALCAKWAAGAPLMGLRAKEIDELMRANRPPR